MADSDSDALIGGFHAVRAALETNAGIGRIWLARGRDDARVRALCQAAAGRGVAVERADMATLDAMLDSVRHQGCVAAYARAGARREADLASVLAASANPWVLALDQVQDPHNLGACLRSAAAAGVTAVIAPRKRAAGLGAAARKVAAGAAERVPFVPVTNLARALAGLRRDAFWVIGLAGHAGQTIYDDALPERLVLVAGGEARGLRALTGRHCDAIVSIPMAAGTQSLNVSVATGVALFEAVRQRRARAAQAR